LGVGKVPILRGYRGAPRWPTGIAGSITHCAGYCAAAVARTKDLAAIGLDAEPNVALPGGVLEMVTQPAERARLRDLAAAAPEISWDCWLGFADADITINAADGTFHARLLVPAASLGGGFTGRWLSRDNLILTAVAVPA
jgi:4'-phosphopantetheinyl transferase EntD